MVWNNPSVREFQRSKLVCNKVLRVLPAHTLGQMQFIQNSTPKGWISEKLQASLSPSITPRQSLATNTTKPAKTPHVSKWHSHQCHHWQLLKNRVLFTEHKSKQLVLPEVTSVKLNRKKVTKDMKRHHIPLKPILISSEVQTSRCWWMYA